MSWIRLFPDPTVLVQIGPLSIRYYALAYIGSLVLGWQIVRRLVRLSPAVATAEQTDDFLTWATLGVVLGGRLGYVLFYQPGAFLAHPAQIFAVWEGGMSFHGGALGVLFAILVFCRMQSIPLLGFADRVATVVPIGLGLGRIANFVNGELWGRPAPLWWPGTIVFPRAGPELRYPSQLYEAALEGLVLFLLLWVLAQRQRIRERFGMLSGIFLLGYAIARSIGETFREPDRFLGFLSDLIPITMGQVLCIPMAVAGIYLILRARRRAVAVPA